MLFPWGIEILLRGVIPLQWEKQTLATGNYAFALGTHTVASGPNSTALGNYVSVNAADTGAFMIGDYSNVTNTLSPGRNSILMRFSGGYKFYSNAALSIGVQLGAGGNSWVVISDKRKKENLVPVDGEDFLQKINSFSLTSWNYKGQDPKSFRHYGPMAQDFYAAFGKDQFGEIGNDTTIASADFDGVNLVAIQALIKRTEQLKTNNDKSALLTRHNKTRSTS